ncbi:hypothetical protein J6590_041251 [Homalodisca vitripennis]|nr:hypothetical protein J6590_041251 [Homalodisca vitripennis]
MGNEDGIVEGELITPAPPEKGRKKRRNQESWKKSVAKRMRVFGRIEKKAQSKAAILKPEESFGMFAEVATVFRLGEDVPVLDWGNAVIDTVKKPGAWHFRFQPSKRLIFQRTPSIVTVQGEVDYNFNIGLPRTICKKGKSWRETSPEVIEKGVKLKEAKLKDIKSLLTSHFGSQWNTMENLQFYQSLIQTQETINDISEAEDDNDEIPVDDDLHM